MTGSLVRRTGHSVHVYRGNLQGQSGLNQAATPPPRFVAAGGLI